MIHIAIAEDNPGIQQALQLCLEQSGFRVSIYGNGEHLIKDDLDLPDLFILDKQLSGINGLDICRHLKLKATTRNIPVIMLSADPYIAGLARTAGADDYLEKPFTIQRLREMIAKHTA
ncbi:response regulator [Danxiaibacter flavus]|uniref:Response regulator n=1 Tax=Danxiaibacter flavus TaxID=3049108 RepID=A0ABV3ZIZ7_9BACT|nr:response regulator [Chitinophagaceae bacterium DXS]